jgi:hypothetical protein
MSGIIGAIRPGHIAFAVGAVGVGALVGGSIADHKDGNVAQGALIGGASALAGLALLVGGASLVRHFSSARNGAAAGASQLGSSLAHVATAPAPTVTSRLITSPTISATLASATHGLQTTAAAATPAVTGGGWRAAVAALFREAPSVAVLRPTSVVVPSIAATPLLPVASTNAGSTFINAMTRFLA